MSGLRERQKEQRKEAILDAAMELFEVGGYNATTVEQIAAKAGVSAPTVFNYFGTKQEILLALVDRADRVGVMEAWVELEKYDNVVDAMCALYSTIATRELEALPVSIWRELLSVTFNTSASKELVAINQRLTQDVAAFLTEMQARGLLNSSFDPEFVAQLLNDYAAQVFARLVQDAEPDYEGHEAYVRRVVETMVLGLRP